MTNKSWKENWSDFKKIMTWNNIKILICAMTPAGLFFYGWTFWFTKIIDLYNQNYSNATTVDQSIMGLAMVLGAIMPLFYLQKIMDFGAWLGYILHFYHNNLTNTLILDDISYSLRDMPLEEREKLKDSLSKYRKLKK